MDYVKYVTRCQRFQIYQQVSIFFKSLKSLSVAFAYQDLEFSLFQINHWEAIYWILHSSHTLSTDWTSVNLYLYCAYWQDRPTKLSEEILKNIYHINKGQSGYIWNHYITWILHEYMPNEWNIMEWNKFDILTEERQRIDWDRDISFAYWNVG